MPHFFINSAIVKGNSAAISDRENYNHIAKSLRIKTGEKLLLIDENQIQYETVVKQVTNKEIIVNVENSYKSCRSLDFGLYLAQSPLRSEAGNFIIEKATELGAEGVYPVISDNCAINRSSVEKKIPKWQRIMYEASKQCERAVVPKCFDITDYEKLIKSGNFQHILAFCERDTDLTLRQYLTEKPLLKNQNILVIIGPEGGFSQKEFDLFKRNNIAMLTLGNLILKAETAVIAALGNIIYEYNNYSKS